MDAFPTLAEAENIAAGMEPDPTAGLMLSAALAEHGVPATLHRIEDQYAEIPLTDGAALLITTRFLSLDHPTSEHNGWMAYLRHADGTAQDRPLYVAGDGHQIVGCGTDTATVAKFATEYRAAPDDFQRARAVLRATIRPRSEARDYTITVDGRDVDTAPWGRAMACAQKSLRAGCHITPGPAGTFTLTAPDGSGRRVDFRPAPRP